MTFGRRDDIMAKLCTKLQSTLPKLSCFVWELKYNKMIPLW